MPFTRGAREVPNQTPASTSDARKRLEGAMNALRDGLREAVENMDTSKIEAFLAAGYEANHAPPPVEPAPWEGISTDRDQPTLARITYDSDYSETRPVFRDTHFVYDADSVDNIGRLDCITHVELLHTYSPETHVPVERALIDAIRAAREGRIGCPDSSLPPLLDALAALADGAES